MIPSLMTVEQFKAKALSAGFKSMGQMNIGETFDVAHLNYKNVIPDRPVASTETEREHQAWRGTVFRQRLTVSGWVEYNLLVFRKIGRG